MFQVGNESMAGEDLMEDPETEEALAEFDFLVSESGEGAGEARSHQSSDWGKLCCDAAPTSWMYICGVTIKFPFAIPLLLFCFF